MNKKFFLGFVISLFGSISLFSNAHASELSTPVTVVKTGVPQAWSDSGANFYYANTHVGPFYAYSGRIYFYVNSVQGDYLSVQAGQILDVPVMITNTANNDSVDGFSNVNKVICTGVDCSLFSTNVSSAGGVAITHYYIKFNTGGDLANIIFSGSDGNYWMYVPSANEHISIPYYTLLQPVSQSSGGSSTPSTPTDMNTVNNYIQFISQQLDSYFNIWNLRSSDMANNLLDIKNKTGYINDINHYISQQIDTLGSSLGGLKLEQEKTNYNLEAQKQQDADQWQAEQDRIESVTTEAENKNDSMTSFHFELHNPVNDILEGFSGSNCVALPTLASWLHLQSNVICSPYPNTIRTTLSTVFSIGSIVLLSTFVFKNLNKDYI